MPQNDNDILQRVAILEEQHKETHEKVNSMDSKLDVLIREFTRYKGMIGGIMLAFSSIGTALWMFREFIFEWMRKHFHF